MEAFSFGSYYPGDSAVHRLDPRTKLLLGFAFLITVLTVGSFCGLVPVAFFVVLVYLAARSRCSTCFPTRVAASCGSLAFCR